jgi:hypothetical protein
MSDKASQFPGTCRAVIMFASFLLLVSSPWTLQAFVPEVYFLRTPDQLRLMSTPNGLGQIERSLFPFYLSIGFELVVLLTLAIVAWFTRRVVATVCYVLAIVGMAGITFLRLSQEFQGPM